MTTRSFALLARWTARVWTILSVVFILGFAIGEGLAGGPKPSLKDWGGLALFPIGVCLGLLVAWYREKLGGVLALGFLIAFYFWNLLRSGHWPRGPFGFLVAAPGLLFLIAAFLSDPRAGRSA